MSSDAPSLMEVNNIVPFGLWSVSDAKQESMCEKAPNQPSRDSESAHQAIVSVHVCIFPYSLYKSMQVKHRNYLSSNRVTPNKSNAWM